MKLDMQTIRAIGAAGIEFFASVRVPGGCKTIFLKPEEVATFLTDPVQATADHMGVTKAEYQRWVDWEGTPQCGANTSKGQRCKNFVSGGSQLSLKRWMAMDGGYCVVHGGEASQRR